MGKLRYLIVAAGLGLSGCGIISMDAPCYTCGAYTASSCTYDYQGNPSPGCYDSLFQDEQGNPIPEVIVVDGGYYVGGEFYPDPETE